MPSAHQDSSWCPCRDGHSCGHPVTSRLCTMWVQPGTSTEILAKFSSFQLEDASNSALFPLAKVPPKGKLCLPGGNLNMKITISVLLGLFGFPSSAALLTQNTLGSSFARGTWAAVDGGICTDQGLAPGIAVGIFLHHDPALSLLYSICFVKHSTHNVWGSWAGTQQLLLTNNLEFTM